MRILYVHSTLQPPPTDTSIDRFFVLSQELEGDVLQPIWFRTPEEVEAHFGPGSYPVYTVGRFRYHWCLGTSAIGLRQRLHTLAFYVRKGLEVFRERPFDCIVTYSHQATALCGAILRLLTGAKLIVEIVTSPHLAYVAGTRNPGWKERLMKAYSDLCLHVSLTAANRAHLLYASQLDHYEYLRHVPASVFHDFVPVSIIGRDEAREEKGRYVLLVGAPWFLKGADTLVKAFLRIAPQFPDVSLRIMGFYPDHAELTALAGGSRQIEILQVRPHLEALKMMEGATVMVMASRCEGLSRAVIEGMAAGLPLIGSNVGGNPTLVREGESGLVFPVGDDAALAERMRTLLSDSDMRHRMGNVGYLRAHDEFSEATYARRFAEMVRDTINPAG
jgi:glycosyltransferase involved in cell wall biosynthesis